MTKTRTGFSCTLFLFSLKNSYVFHLLLLRKIRNFLKISILQEPNSKIYIHLQ